MRKGKNEFPMNYVFIMLLILCYEQYQPVYVCLCVFFVRSFRRAFSFVPSIFACVHMNRLCTLPVFHLVICDIEIDISTVNNTNFIRAVIVQTIYKKKHQQRAITISL